MTLNLKNFLNPKVKMAKMGEYQPLKAIDGLQISSVSADLYGDGRDDLSLFFFENGANFAAVYTQSTVISASISWNLRLKRHFVRALLVNTKNANTFTGEKGIQALKEISKTLSKALTLKASQSPDGIQETIKPNEIYNLGAMSHVGVSFELPEYTANVDGLGVLRILESGF